MNHRLGIPSGGIFEIEVFFAEVCMSVVNIFPVMFAGPRSTLYLLDRGNSDGCYHLGSFDGYIFCSRARPSSGEEGKGEGEG